MMPAPFDLLPYLLEGVWVTIQVFAGATVFAVLAALLAGLARLAPLWPVRWLAGTYVEVFRGTSALVQLFWFYFVLPEFGIFLEKRTVGIVVLGLNYGAFGAEIVRGAVRSIPRGQTEAAIALNLSSFDRVWRIILPQALVRMLPPWGNLQIEMLKNTALVLFIGVADLTYQSKVLQSDTQRTVEIFGLSLLLYFALALAVTAAVRGLERCARRGLQPGSD
jgi:polar amino acid transport system permease protein